MAKQGAAPWFKFYPKDFSSDEHVEVMSPAAVGAYILLLCKAWHSTPGGTLPNDDRKLARFARMTLAEWKEVRDEVLVAWSVDGDRIVQRRMQADHEEMSEIGRKRASAGRKAHKSSSERENPGKCRANAEQMPSKCSDFAEAKEQQMNSKGSGKSETTCSRFAAVRASDSESESISVSSSPSVSSSDSCSGSEVGGAGGGGDSDDGKFELTNDPVDGEPESEYPRAFEEFYEAYPRKAAKKDAHAAWAARPSHMRQKLFDRATAYRKALSGELEKGAPAAGPWIRQGRYDDPPDEWRRMAARTLDLPDPDRPAMGRKTTTTVTSGNSWAQRKANG